MDMSVINYELIEALVIHVVGQQLKGGAQALLQVGGPGYRIKGVFAW